MSLIVGYCCHINREHVVPRSHYLLVWVLFIISVVDTIIVFVFSFLCY